MSLGLIQPMKFDLVKSAMASLLASERDAQLALLASKEAAYQKAVLLPQQYEITGGVGDAAVLNENVNYRYATEDWAGLAAIIFKDGDWYIENGSGSISFSAPDNGEDYPPLTFTRTTDDGEETLTLTDTGATIPAEIEALHFPDDKIANFYNFNVFKNRFRLPDASQLPAVNIRNASGKFGVGSGKNFIDGKWHSYFLSIECYSVSTAEPNIDADELAAERLDYLFAQVWNTFEAESNFYKGLKSVVRKAGFVEWKQLPADQTPNSAESILAIQAIYELQFEELAEMMTGEEFKKLVISLEIDSQFISPFVTVEK